MNTFERNPLCAAGWLLLLISCSTVAGNIGLSIFGDLELRPMFEGTSGKVIFILTILLGIFSFWRITRHLRPA